MTAHMNLSEQSHNLKTTPQQSHSDVASTSIRRCFDVSCLLGARLFILHRLRILNNFSDFNKILHIKGPQVRASVVLHSLKKRFLRCIADTNAVFFFSHTRSEFPLFLPM